MSWWEWLKSWFVQQPCYGGDDEPLKTMGRPRSSGWGPLQKALIAAKPYCQICKITKRDVEAKGGRLIGHHIIAFHERPDLELDPENVAIVCELDGRCCHFSVGHLRDWRKTNPKFRELVKVMESL